MLRIALIAMTEPVEDGGLPRAFLTVAGRSVAQRQLELALAMGSQRVICLVSEAVPELVDLMRQAEAGAAAFHVADGPEALMKLIAAEDELLVFSDGLLIEPEKAIPLLTGEDAVLVQPIEAALPLGFERIDLTRGGVGAIRIPGRLVERLDELPSDCDVPSALTRIALQERIPMREIPIEARGGVGWRLVRTPAEAQALEDAWVTLSLGDSRAANLSEAIARKGLAAFGSSLLQKGFTSGKVALGAGLSLLLALAVSWSGASALALVLIAVAALIGSVATLLGRIEQGASGALATVPLMTTLGGMIDASLVMMVIRDARAPDESLLTLGFAPLMLIGLLRLAHRLFQPGWVRLIEDRMLMALLLTLAAALDRLTLGVQLLALLIAGGAIVRAAIQSRRSGVS